MRRGTIVDATIISAPSSTTNRTKERDHEMHQTKKGNQWYFGTKAHIGVDSQTKLIHSVAATAANAHDSQMLPQLLHGQETRVWGDSASSGQRDAIQQHAPQGHEFHSGESAPPWAAERGGAGSQPHQVESPGESRACVLGDQADLWLDQSTESGAGKEYALAVYQLRVGEFVYVAAAPGGGSLADGGAKEVPDDSPSSQPREPHSRASHIPLLTHSEPAFVAYR